MAFKTFLCEKKTNDLRHHGTIQCSFVCLGWNETHVEDQPSIILRHHTCCKNYIWPPKRQFKNKITKKWLDDFKHDNFKMITYQVFNNRSKNDLSMDVSPRKC
jgi:hypothetical protein